MEKFVILYLGNNVLKWDNNTQIKSWDFWFNLKLLIPYLGLLKNTFSAEALERIYCNFFLYIFKVLEKYKWEGEGETCPYLDPDISLLLQSIVMAVQGTNPDGEVQVGGGGGGGGGTPP